MEEGDVMGRIELIPGYGGSKFRKNSLFLLDN